MELVRVVDNGGGIPRRRVAAGRGQPRHEQARRGRDLFRVRTLGFRGEALASIAEVSHFTIRSRTGRIDRRRRTGSHRRRAAPIVPCGCPGARSSRCRNLFVNTPVRRKFLRSTQTEMGHVDRGFYPPGPGLARRSIRAARTTTACCTIWPPPGVARRGSRRSSAPSWPKSIPSRVTTAGSTWRASSPIPSQSRTNARMQYLFLNGRYVRDRSLQHALTEAYRGLLLDGPVPDFVLCASTCPPDMVDVNVHPTKLEVRFQDGGRLYSQLLGTIRTRFLTTDLTDTRPAPSVPDRQRPRHDVGGGPSDCSAAFVDWAKAELACTVPVDRLARPTARSRPARRPSNVWIGRGSDCRTRPGFAFAARRREQGAGLAEETEPADGSWRSAGADRRAAAACASRLGTALVGMPPASTATRQPAHSPRHVRG